MLMEQTPSQQNWQPYNSLKRPGQMRAQSYQTVAHGADTIQFFQLQPDALAAAVEQVKAAYPHCTVVAAGNLTEENVTEYAATGVDGLVSSAFYRAEPIQMQAQFHTN